MPNVCPAVFKHQGELREIDFYGWLRIQAAISLMEMQDKPTPGDTGWLASYLNGCLAVKQCGRCDDTGIIDVTGGEYQTYNDTHCPSCMKVRQDKWKAL